MNFQGMNSQYGFNDFTAKAVEKEEISKMTTMQGGSCPYTGGMNANPYMMPNMVYGNPAAVSSVQGCNQVVNKCFVQDVPHYVNYNTHVVNNCVKRHYTVPTYSQTEETVYSDEFIGQPAPVMGFGPAVGTPYNTVNPGMGVPFNTPMNPGCSGTGYGF